MTTMGQLKSVPKIPVIVVTGSTGSGKSKLGIELAQRFNGEIISADSMQVYRGLDIITNKVTEEEQKAAKHHMIDFIDPLLTDYTVVDFRNKALPIVDSLYNNKTPPLIVGGTSYYIESLIYNVLINPSGINKRKAAEAEPRIESESKVITTESNGHTNGCDGEEKCINDCRELTYSDVEKLDSVDVERLPSEVLYACLQEVDPVRADEVHPMEKRKIIRSIQVYREGGVPHSTLLQQQRSSSGGSVLGGGLQYPDNTLILWLRSQQDVLDTRLDTRVDDMMTRGLVKELEEFHAQYNADRKPDYTRGIFQSIGFKEFHNYLILDDADKHSDAGKKLLADGVEMLKIVTRRYARRQVKWIRNRFLWEDRAGPPVYSLDATDVGAWEENVLTPAVAIVEAFMNSTVSPRAPVPPIVRDKGVKKNYYCSDCDLTLQGSLVRDVHMAGKKHARQVKHNKKIKLAQTT